MLTNTQFFNSFQFDLLQLEHNYAMQFDGRPYYYLGKIISGKARITSAQNDLQLGEGDIFFIPKNLKYRSHWSTEGNNIVFYSFGFSAIPVDVQADFQLQKLDCTAEEAALFHELEQNVQVSPISVGTLYRFLGKVFPKMTVLPKSKADIILDTAMEFMRSNQNYTMADVAHHCRVSECTLFLKFRKHLGKTPVEIRHQILAEKAEKLLISTDLSVEDISNSLGISSSSYFRKILKATTGKTPMQIRKSQRQLL